MPRDKVLALFRPGFHWLLLTIPLLLPLSTQLMIYWPPVVAAAIPLFVMFGLLPLFDYLLGRETVNLPERHFTLLERRLLPLLCVPAQLSLLIWGIGQLSGLGFWAGLVWLLSLGVIGGVLAINVAHELIRRRSCLDRAAGGVLLAMVNYGGFKVEHLRSHHLYVATPKDTSTAPLNESVYHFVLRSLWVNPRHAWRLESTHLARRGVSVWHWRNELLYWHGLSLLFLTFFALTAGWVGAIAYLFQGVVAAATLEVINYIEHYGLRRQRLADGRYEAPDERHSWNSDYFLSNAILLQLQRHADHHAHPLRAFPYLSHRPTAPQLPLGYAAMFPLALCPPLWRRIMNPRVKAYVGG